MARGSRKDKRREAGEAPPLDFVLYECAGEDPRPRVEFPDGADVGSYAALDVDSLGSAYELDADDPDTEYVAVMVVVVKASTLARAAAAMVARAAEVADHLFHDAARVEVDE